jgi:farnesyl-diphosphate farnesyltransferase
MSATVSVEVPSGKDKGDENFPVGSLLIRRALRPHVHAFYAFARQADDVADSATLAADEKIARLDRMEAVLLGRAPDAGAPSAARLRGSLAETGVTARHSQDLLAAFRQDATKRRYASWTELLDYCRLSAMPVGRHVLDLHGEAPATYAPSDPLCAALQVVNHLQDLALDLAHLDRCYVPLDLLDAAGARVEDLAGPALTSALRRVVDAVLDETDTLNRAGAALPGVVRDRRLRTECAVISGLARRLAARLRREDPLAGRVKLGRGDVAGSVLRALGWLA